MLGLDLGGTNIKVSLLEPESDGYRVLSVEERPTEANAGPDRVTANLVDAARSHFVEGEIGSIGLGVPGLFDPDRGEIELFPNLPGPWKGFPLQHRMEQALDTSVTTVNDARAFTLAEGTIGAGKGTGSWLA
jgi:glucokinase